jgi:hypothetical protein
LQGQWRVKLTAHALQIPRRGRVERADAEAEGFCCGGRCEEAEEVMVVFWE